MNKEYIKSKHFKKYISSQPYFIWNNVKIEEDEFNIDNFWNEETHDADPEYAAIISKSLDKVRKTKVDELMEKYDARYPEGKAVEERIESTKKLISENKFIIDPVFEYRDALAQPFAYDSEHEVVYYLSAPSKLKLPLIVNPFWDYQIMNRLEIPVSDIVYFISSSEEEKQTKGENLFIESNKIHPSKAGKPSVPQEDKDQEKLIDILETIINRGSDLRDSWWMSDFALDHVIDQINDAKDAKKFDAKLLYLDLRKPWDNKALKDKLLEMNFEFAGWNGNIFKKEWIFEYFNEDCQEAYAPWIAKKKYMSYKESLEVKYIKDLKSPAIDKSKMGDYEKLKKANKVIWYDFEGFSMPYPIIDKSLPYHQIVFQVSVIKTVNNKEVDLENLVIDPKNIKVSDFVKIIDAVYDKDAEYYVVYNKGYEIPRMKKMVQYMRSHGMAKEANECQRKVDEIEAKTIDLMILFKITSGKFLGSGKEPAIILDGQKGNASIKNVEKYITGKNIQLPRPIKQYSSLNVKNGGEAMRTAIERFIGVIGDEKWKSILDDLKEYCENDVRAMIMVYDYVEKLWKEN